MTSDAPHTIATPGAAIFVADASAEAERIARALRAEGYVVVDVPTALLGARVAVQKPALVLLDVDAEGALGVLARIREMPGGQSIDVVFVGEAGRTLTDAKAALAAGGSGFFPRPVDVAAVVRKAKSLAPIDGDSRPETGMTPPPAIPSSRARPASPTSSNEPPPAPSTPPSVRGVGPVSLGPPPSGLDPPVDPSELGLPSQPAPAVGTQLSDELQRVLRTAEERVGQGFRASSEPPSPEEEVDAVLPAELLAALDEPLPFEEDEEGASGGGSAVWQGRTPGRGGTTGTGAGTGLRTGSDPSPTPPRATAALITSRPPAAYDTPTPAPRSPSPLDDGERETPRPPRRGSYAPDLTPLPVVDPVPSDLGVDDAPETPRPLLRSTRFDSSPPTTGSFAVSTRDEPEVDARDERNEVEPLDEPPLAIVPSSVVFGAGDALQLLAKAVAERHTGCLCFDDGAGLRRVVLRDGDLTTAGSSFEDETLTAFLAARGEVPKDVAKRLGARLPPFGRHAGAALVAHGHLAQDRLWEVLRGHAEWIVGRVVILGSGTCIYEAEPPGRLRAEPSVFGGSTGCEVLVEVVRRVTPPVVAVQRLGGGRARLADGPRRVLLGECALTPAEVELVERSRGATIAEVVDSAGAPEIATVLFGLVTLGVLEVMSASRRSSAPPPERDPLDEEALRERVRARLDLVEEGDYFAILGVPRIATPYEIKRAYLEMRRSLEPTRLLTAATADLADSIATILEVADEAYEILRDPTRRERYRKAIEGTPPD